jgi:DNA-binding GntR family transcriptional regulator
VDASNALPDDGLETPEDLLPRLERMILDGEIGAGGRLNELALSRRFGVSRFLLRDLLHRLERKGLVEFVRNRGAVVRSLDVKAAVDLYDLRAALFRLAARLACQRATPQDLAGLHELDRAMAQAAAADAFARYYGLNLDFHAALMAAARNAAAAEAYQTAVKALHLFRRRTLLRPAQLSVSRREHERLLAALRARDAAAAGRAAEQHILLGKQRMLETLESSAGD